jgi:hypothetical protein
MTTQPATQPISASVHPLTILVAQGVSSLDYFYGSALDGTIEAVAHASGLATTLDERASIRGQVALVLARCGWRLSAAEQLEAQAAAHALGQAGV